jgi:protein involved in polysaccharide export with SLBB domain
MKIFKPLRLIPLTVFIATHLFGCLRYTPSAKELSDRASSSSATKLNDERTLKTGGQAEKDDLSTIRLLAGEDAFIRHEELLNQRVSALLNERAHLIQQETISSSGYPLGGGDAIDLSVFGFNNLNVNTTISPDGSVALPLLGRVALGGLSIEDAQSNLTRRYSNFIRSPQVLLQLKTPQRSRVSVIGEVNKPGTYPLNRRGVLLTEILSEAGGRTPSAGSRVVLLPAPRLNETNLSNNNQPSLADKAPLDADPNQQSLPVKLITNGKGKNETFRNEALPIPNSGIEIEIEDLFGTIDKGPLLIPLVPGDTIIVPEAGTYEVDGEVITPGSFRLTGRTSVIGAIASAKGFTYSADVNNVELIRDIGSGEKALISLDLEQVGLRGARDVRLRNGDLVRVPSHSTRFFKRQIVETINGIFNVVGVNQRMN